jgi:hypothetical protein
MWLHSLTTRRGRRLRAYSPSKSSVAAYLGDERSSSIIDSPCPPPRRRFRPPRCGQRVGSA